MFRVLQGMRLERMWADLKLYWNKFHSSKNGFVADDCQPNSAFSALSDQTCLATFLGVRNEDNELVKVLKALMMMQVCCCNKCLITVFVIVLTCGLLDQVNIAMFCC